MEHLGILALIFIVWNGLGFMMTYCLGVVGFDFIKESEGLEYLNPVYIYKNCEVNVFGAIMFMALLNLLCPILSFGYWLYMLCTVGRKS